MHGSSVTYHPTSGYLDHTMKKTLPSLILFLALVVPATAQQDIGLTMAGGGFLTVLYGQDCGPVSCQPMVGSVVGVGTSRNIMHFSAPSTLYVIAFGTPGPCVSVPGFGNSLLLSNVFVLDVGLTSAPPFVPLPCQQGSAGTTLTIPANAPTGFVFRLQSMGVSPSTGAFAFGPAIEATTI